MQEKTTKKMLESITFLKIRLIESLVESKENLWEEKIIYFKDFKEYQIGEPTAKKLKDTSLKNIVRMGIITTEKKEGPFSIEIDYVEFIK